MSTLPKSIDDTLALLARADYVAERSLATAVFLALKMGRPLFLEGEAGVGDRNREGSVRRPRPDAGAPAVLRRPRHRLGRIRMELFAPDDRNQACGIAGGFPR